MLDILKILYLMKSTKVKRSQELSREIKVKSKWNWPKDNSSSRWFEGFVLDFSVGVCLLNHVQGS